MAKKKKMVPEIEPEKVEARRVGAEGWPATWLLPRREAGRSCPRCSGTIRRITVSGRGTYYCPDHQT